VNKTRLAVVVGLMGAYYIIASVFLPLELPYFVTPSACIFALFFPYITPKHRMTITLIYQAIHVFVFGILLSSFKSLIMDILSSEPSSVTDPSGTSALFWLVYGVLEFIHVPVVGILWVISVLYFLIVITQYVIMFTQPYSVYFIYKWVGLVGRMRKAFPHASPEWFKS